MTSDDPNESESPGRLWLACRAFGSRRSFDLGKVFTLTWRCCSWSDPTPIYPLVNMNPNPNPNPNPFDSPPQDHVPELHDSLDVPKMSSNAPPTQPKSIPPESPTAEVQVHRLRSGDADADASMRGPGPGARTDSDASDASKTRQHVAATLIQAAKEEHSYTPLTAIRKYWRAFVWCM